MICLHTDDKWTQVPVCKYKACNPMCAAAVSLDDIVYQQILLTYHKLYDR